MSEISDEKINIVLINDDQTLLKLLSGFLIKEGFHTRVYSDAVSALEGIDHNSPPSLIVTDLNMPEIDGWRLCRLLRSPEYKHLNDVPILVLSATFSEEDASRITANLGANAFLPSPVIKKDFLKAVHSLINNEKPILYTRILIIEDSTTQLGLLKRTFESYGYKVDTAHNCKSGIDRIHKAKFDAAIIDFHLPDENGDLLLELLRKEQPECVCIMMTADTCPEFAVDWMRKGAAAYIRKPFVLDYLIELLAKARREQAMLRMVDILEARTKALHDTEHRLTHILHGASDGLWDWNITNDEMYFSPRWKEMLGYKDEELDNKLSTWENLTDPLDKDRILYILKNFIEGKIPKYEVEYRMLHKNGNWVNILSRGSIIRDEDGNVIRVVGSHVDITDLKKVETEKEENEAQYKAIIETSVDGFCITDKKGNILEINDAYINMSGYSRNEMLKMNIRDIEAKENKDEIFNHINRVMKEGNGLFETLHRKKDGTIWQVEINATYWPIAGGRFFVFLRDINRRKSSEALLRMRVRLSDMAVHSTIDEVMQAALDSAELFTGSEIGFFHFVDEDQKTLTLQTWSKNTLANMCRAEGKGQHYQIDKAGVWVECFYKKEPVIHNDYASLPNRKGMPDGHAPVIRELTVPIIRDGIVTAILGVGNKKSDYDQDDVEIVQTLASIVMDIVSKKKVEEALKTSESNFKRAQEVAHIGSWVLNLRNKIYQCSEETCRIFGYPMSLFQSYSSFHSNIMNEDKEKVNTAWDKAMSGGPYDIDFKISINKTIKLVHEKAEIEFDKTGNPIVAVGTTQDMTDRMHLEHQLLQAQKMESVGRLAGGVAHDFNNMLGVILCCVDMALDDINSEHPLFTSLKDIQNAALRSSDLTRQLLAFARKQTISPRILNLNDTVSGMIKMLRRLIGEEIKLEWKPGGEIWYVKMDPAQIDQILANLIVNAKDSIKEKGMITIETANQYLDKEYIGLHPGYITGEFVLLSISDTGEGMDKIVLEKIFEPFFTTKETGKGTGLGLATVYGIVKQNNGFINVYSEPKVGTTFKIYLPRILSAAEKIIESPEKENLNGSETILLVEDENTFLNIGKNILEKYGYKILPARSPVEALKVARQYPEKIHMLITDVVLPEINGKDLSKKIISMRQDIKVLFMSGYTSDVIAHHGILNEGIHFLQKPFSPVIFARKVREILDL